MPVLQTSDWYSENSVLHPLAVGSSTLVIVFVYIRLASNRTLSPTTIYTWLCNIILGSTLSRILTQPDLNFTRGLISVGTILAVEYVTTWLISHHGRPFAHIFRKPPLLLIFRGEVDWELARAHRLSPEGIREACRSKGIARFDAVEALVLEGNGTFSLLSRKDAENLVKGDSRAEDVWASVPGYLKKLEEWEKNGPFVKIESMGAVTIS